MKKSQSSWLLRGGIAITTIGLLRGISQWFNIPRQQIRNTVVRAMPDTWPLLLMIAGVTLIVIYINRDE